jgi:hypothetical protein
MVRQMTAVADRCRSNYKKLSPTPSGAASARSGYHHAARRCSISRKLR